MIESRKKWKYLDALDNVLADKPSTHPAVLIDTFNNEHEEQVGISEESHMHYTNNKNTLAEVCTFNVIHKLSYALYKIIVWFVE